ncbi:MAG: NAD(P)H-dependent glycerol-3-phosphate dehydrogenase [Wenzhouxiangella sp.]|jgi:glycerol-3-phosphate dehydrogenase (NAD(P)+)|nr:NAD(P)H-dependent glycerol-3-phosphate dehydrogenase [Wenzhouxiangella sp.]
MQSRKIGILGAGSWGTALGMHLARRGHSVVLWDINEAHVAQVQSEGRNERFLPGIEFPERLEICADLEQVGQSSEHLLIVTPSHAFAETLDRVRPFLSSASGLTWATKGFEPGSARLLHEVAREALGDEIPLALITGPSFAREVALGLPTAVTVAASTPAFGAAWAEWLHGGNFRAYYTADLPGAELGGALKNVLAVACGIADGLGLGGNTRAALITRGLAEMMRLGRALGASPLTLTGLAGVGDLVLTCTGDLSRNRRLGLALAEGKSLDVALEEIGQVVEAVRTAEEAMRLARRHQVEMPITEQVYGILFEGWSARKGVQVLMERDLKPETD